MSDLSYAARSSRPELDADAVVIGAGAAGLAVAGALAHPARRLRVMVLEPRAIRANPRRWLIAAEPGHTLTARADAVFDEVILCGRAHALPRLRIHHVRAGAVQQAMLERLRDHPLARVEEGVRIEGVTGKPGRTCVETSLGAIRARAVVDTRPGPAAHVAAGQWTQISYLARLESVDAAPQFSLSRPAADGQGVSLDQIVILPGGEALVEAVRFAPPGDQGAGVEGRASDLIKALGGDPDTTPRHRIVMPLQEPKTAERASPAVIARAGVAGLRFSTGTAAVRLTRWAEAAATRFAETGRFPAPPGPPAQARAARALALSQLQQGPGSAAHWLASVMEDGAPEPALRFLAGTPGWRDDVRAFLRTRNAS